jgi:hypothetical protein
MPLRLAILILSAAAIGYEVLLIRLFSIIQWQQFAAMVISLALLGYGVSGSCLALVRSRLLSGRSSTPGRAVLIGAVSFGPLSVGAYLLAQRLPFNALALVWEPEQLLWLLLVYLVLALPFLSVGFTIGLCLTVWREEIPRFYQADLLGAGLGAAGVMLALWVLSPERSLLVIGTSGLLAATVASLDSRVAFKRSSTALLAVISLSSMIIPGTWIDLRRSEYKNLSKALLVPGAEVMMERSSPLAVLSVVRSPKVPLRYAPGLSLAYGGILPEQLGIFEDGDGMAVVDRRSPGEGPSGYRDFQVSSVAYQLTENPRVLIVGLGGGGEVISALGHGAASVMVVEQNPQLSALLLGELAEFSGHLLEEPGVEVTVGEPRAFLASRRDAWDLIHLTDMQSLTVSGGGVGAAGVSYLYTVEALEELAEHLTPGGLLSVTRRLRVPPRDSLKLFATAWEALESLERGSAQDSLAMVRSWDAVTLLMKRGGWSSTELEELRAWSRDRWLDVVFLPGMRPEEANRFNRLEKPYLHLGTTALAGEDRQDFIEDYKFLIRPASDDRPFFSHFFRWRALPELIELRGRGGASLVEWGYLVAVGTLLQAILAGSVLILLPLLLRQGWRHGREGSVTTWSFFAALGVAFLMLEIAYIQRVTVYVGNPIFAVATALAAFLVFAGLGSGSVSRLSDSKAQALESKIGFVAGAIVLLCLLHLGLAPVIFRATQALALGWKTLLSVAVVAPLAFAMGMPFPLALQRLGRTHPERIPLAWGINGWATVVSAALAPLVAIHFGLNALVVFAAVCYGLAGLVAGSVGGGGPSRARLAVGSRLEGSGSDG